jgi:hypothetical protein
LTEHFGGLGYGWSAEIVRLVVAVLLRALKVNYKNLRTFDLSLTLDNQTLPLPGRTARIPLQLVSVHESEDFEKRTAAVVYQIRLLEELLRLAAVEVARSLQFRLSDSERIDCLPPS